jgi:hypothetical protein
MAIENDDDDNKLNLEILIKQNKIKINHIFKVDIDIIYNIFIQLHHYKEIFNGLIHEIVCLEGKPILNSKGSQFKLIWRDVITRFRIANVIETPTFKKLNFYFYEIMPTEFCFNVLYKFYKNTTEPHLTYYSYEVAFQSPQAMSFHQIQLSSYDYIDVLINFENHVQKNVKTTEQVESVIIDCDIDSLWEVLQDWGKFKELAPMIADKVEYERDVGDTHIKLLFNSKGGDIVHVLRVIKCFRGDREARFILSLLNSSLKSLSQDLEFSLYSLGGGQCIFIFRHVFQRIIDKGFLKELSKNKRLILNSLRDNIVSKKKEKDSIHFSCNDSTTLDEAIDL